jgi:hypothetical protein
MRAGERLELTAVKITVKFRYTFSQKFPIDGAVAAQTKGTIRYYGP